MDVNDQIYIQSKGLVNIKKPRTMKVKDLTVIVAPDKIKEEIENIDVIDISNKKNEYVVISLIYVVRKIKEKYSNITIEVIGEDQVLLNIKKIQPKKDSKIFEYFKVFIVCSIVFFGAALAINHFHADVNMKEAHSSIYKLITGKEEDRPLMLQISYSLGIGIGMIAFFYKISPKAPKDEPSPLDLELYLYNQNVREYIIDKEQDNVYR